MDSFSPSDAVPYAAARPGQARPGPLIAEQLMLLAFTPGDGRLRMGSSFVSYGLAGAVLTELALRGAITVADRPVTARMRRLYWLPGQPAAGDPLLDAVAWRIAREKPRRLVWWIRRTHIGTPGQVLPRLIAAGLVRTSPGVLRPRHYLAAPAARAGLISQVQQVLLGGPGAAAKLWASEPELTALTSLAFACRLLRTGWLMPRGQRRLGDATLRAIRYRDPIGQAVADVVREAAQPP